MKDKNKVIDKVNEVGNAAKDAFAKEAAKKKKKEEQAFQNLRFKMKQ